MIKQFIPRIRTCDLDVSAVQLNPLVPLDNRSSGSEDPVAFLPHQDHWPQVSDVTGQGEGVTHLDPVEPPFGQDLGRPGWEERVLVFPRCLVATCLKMRVFFYFDLNLTE